MFVKIGTKDIREKMGEILDCVNLKGDEFIIERKNKPIAALVPVRKLKAIQNAARRFLIDFLDEQEGDLSHKESEELIEEAKLKTRKKQKKKR